MNNILRKVNNLKKQCAVIFLALKRKDTPWFAKVMAAITIGYALSPVDLIPDFIPILGYLDDIIILPFFIWVCLKLIPNTIILECVGQAENLWENGKPKKWYFAIPIVSIWFAISLVVIKTIWIRYL